MNSKKTSSIKIILIGWGMTAFTLFGSIFLSMINKVEEYVTYVKSEPIYETVDEIVPVDVYKQEAPVFPIKATGKELILLDKSGSMKDFVSSVYTSNISFFTKHDVWAFDTNVYQDVDVEAIEFGGDTNIFQAINIAAEQGYDTIWLCSDLEHNSGEIALLDMCEEITIIVYSPKILDSEKSQKSVEELKKCNTKVITIS